jgi:hypothetical protein
MALNEHGFSIIEIPEPGPEFMDSFADLAFDEHSGGNHKYRRFSQYRLYFQDGRWQLELLPHRPYLAYSKYNKFAGGILRHYQPLQIDPTEVAALAATTIPLDTSVDWQINTHQHRVLTGPGIKGHVVPEGPHQDGHEYVMIAVYARHQITGAEMSLMPVGGGEPFYRTTLQAGQAVVLDDQRMFHYVTDIEPVSETGHRDIIIIAFSKWADRWYGPEFENQALEKDEQQ